jgi:multicomponent K+:H+ antiporter subunit G
MTPVATIVDVIAGGLLLGSAALSLVAALGLLRLPDFFQRMHAPALATTLGTWCAALASIVHFWVSDFGLRSTVVVILLGLTAPVTTVLLARATLFRRRTSEGAVPGEAARDAEDGGRR